MKVQDLMTQKVLTVAPQDSVERVFLMFIYEKIRHVPVVEKKKLVGIISDRDLKKIVGAPKKFLVRPDGTTLTITARKVHTLMTSKVVTVEPRQRAADAAALMAKKKIGALPVVHRNRLVGILTETDILRAFVKLCNELDSINLKPLVDLLQGLNPEKPPRPTRR